MASAIDGGVTVLLSPSLIGVLVMFVMCPAVELAAVLAFIEVEEPGCYEKKRLVLTSQRN